MNPDNNNNKEILIVEDSLTQAELLKFLLEKNDYRVWVAYNGREAIDMITKKGKPALVISDIIMPEMDGYELCRCIKKDENLKDIPVILLTSLSDSKDVLKGLECGADNFITKPYDEKYILSRVQYILANRLIREREKMEMGIKMFFGGQEYYITAARQQILDLLISTYETALQKNTELQKVQDDLKTLNELLEKKVDERTASLMAEMEVRRLAEEELCKVNRALKTLSESNRALVRSFDESTLLHDLCRIIVESGGYGLAWIGFAQQDGKNSLRVLAQCGYEEEDIEGMEISLADMKTCEAQALLTGKPCIVRNILTDQEHTKYRAEAIKQGYASFISIPFNTSVQPSGVLNIYAKEADAFDKKEVELLAETAEDLAFGIKMLRMRAQHEKAEIEINRQASIIKNIPESVCTMDKNNNILSWNDGAEKMLGYKREEIIGKPITIIIPEEQAQKELEHCLNILNKEGVYTDYESVRLTKDGRIIPVEITGVALRDGNQNKIVYASIMKDITERKRAEEARRENEARLKVALSPIDISVFNQDLDLRYTWMYQPQLGYTSEQVIGKTDTELLPPEAARQVTEIKRKVLEKGTGAHCEIEVALEGRTVYYDLVVEPLRNASGQVVGITGASLDISERKRAEETLKENEEKYRTMIEFSNDMIWTADLSGRFQFCNRQTEEVSGYKLEEWRNQEYSPLIIKEEFPTLMEIFSKVLKGQPQQYEATVKKRDGTVLILSINTAPIYSKGVMIGTVSFGRDITESRRAQEKLRENSLYTRSLIEVSLDPLVTISKYGKITDVNKTAELVTGFSREQLIASDFCDYFTEPEKAREGYQQVLEKGFIKDYPLAIRHVSGSITDVLYNATVYKDAAGNVAGIFAAARDITERKKAEETLRESEEMNRLLIDFSPFGIVIHCEGIITFINSQAMKVLGATSVEEIAGKPILDIVHPAYLDIVKERILMEERGQIAPLIEQKFIRIDGSPVDVEIVAIPVNFRGKIYKYGVFHEITERKKAEEIRIEKERLEYASKAKSDFLASMSHELRTPLNSVLGFSQLLNDGIAGELNEKQKHFIENINNSGNFLLNLINDILDLSKIEAGKIELNLEKINLQATVGETLSLIKEKAMKHRVNIKNEFEPGIDLIDADKQRVKQILFNLLSNAVKFSKEEGGTVTIFTKKVDENVQISVSDTGIGIKPENMEKLFQKFEQLDKGISQKYGGTGLGLAISKQLVELHGGRVWAESKYGEGSTFTFLIPLVVKKKEG